LAQEADNVLSEKIIIQSLAELAKHQLSTEVREAAINSATPSSDLSPEQIDAVLSKAVQEAFRNIDDRDYHGIVKLEAKEMIDLALAVYGFGAEVKAAFRP
jgi:hypothetical protein